VSAAASIRFDVAVPAAAFEAPAGAVGMTRLSLPGYEDTGTPGEPALPSRVLMVAVPPEGSVRVSAAGFDAETFEGVSLAPRPHVTRGAEQDPHYVRSPEAYARSSAPGSARLIDVTWIRNQRVARIAVTPAQYDPRTRRLSLSRRVEVEVQTSGGQATTRRAEDPDPFEDVYRNVLVNYEQGTTWRRPAPAPRAMRLETATVESGGVFVGRSWIKIAIPHTGFYRVDFGALRLLDLFNNDVNVSVDSLRLFTWPGYPVLAERDFCDTCDYREVAMGVIDNNDGLLNDNDEGFYFFALGASDWANLYDPARPDTVFVNHPYETRNYYYLTISTPEDPVPGPRRRIAAIAGDPSPGGGEITPTTFTARSHFEIDDPNEYWPDASAFGSTMFWEKWFWQSVGMGDQFTTTFGLPGFDTTKVARLRLRLWGLGGVCETCPCPTVDPVAHKTVVSVNDWSVGLYSWGSRNVRGGQTSMTMDLLIQPPLSAPPLPGGGDPDSVLLPGPRRARGRLNQTSNELTVKVPLVACTGRNDLQGIAWFDLFYPRRFEPYGDILDFDSPAASGNYLYRIGPFTPAAAPRIFDVTDPYDPFEIVGADTTLEASGQFLSFETVQPGSRRYRVVQDTSIVELTGSSVFMAPSTSLVNLRDRAEGGRYVVIFYDGFKVAADSLAAWRQYRQGFSTFTVPISALYDQFSGGRTDPSAIRDFLRAAYLRWPAGAKPEYVTLLGDASYDFKNYLGVAVPGQPGSLLPSYENSYDIYVERQYATDDWLLNALDEPTDTGPVPDFFGGRLPAGSPEIAMSIVREKVLAYERTAPFGEYRNRLMLIADDETVGNGLDPLGWQHVRYSYFLDAFFTPPHIDRRYVYLHTYPSPPGQNNKPDAAADIVANLEQGVALFNYIGHGSPFQLADERVLVDQDVLNLRNADRLPLFIAASCDVGKFNNPKVNSLGELLITHRGGGAIGVISATELAFAGQNAQLNNELFAQIFQRAPVGRYHVPISEALVNGKLAGSGTVNSQKYQLLGDAATVLNLPGLWIEVTLRDSAGGPAVTDLRPGSTLDFEGNVLDRPGGDPVALDGVASILIEDSKPLVEPNDCHGLTCPQYAFYAGPIFRGDASVHLGRFQGRFVVPLDARQGNAGRFRVYASGAVPGAVGGTVENDGAGSVATRIRSDIVTRDDHDGPRITLAFEGGSTVVRPDAVLKVVLFDPSGILTTGHSPQNGIVVTIDDNSGNRRDISSSFRYAADSYQSGIATYRLKDVAPGPHRIKVSAADNLAAGLNAAQHRSSATIEFEVQEVPPLSVSRAILFPNPVRSGAGGGGQFVIDAPGDAANVLLRIYTVSGKLIRSLRSFGGQGQLQLAWDGLDQEGQALANGVYLFKVNVNAREADGRSSAQQHADAEGRFVVVGH
jgi:hypothetical protein